MQGLEPCSLSPVHWWQGEPLPAERMEQKCPIQATNVCLFPALGDTGATGHAEQRGTEPLSPFTLSLTHLFAFPQRFKSSGSSWLDESGLDRKSVV